jgi:hypothetical protein
LAAVVSLVHVQVASLLLVQAGAVGVVAAAASLRVQVAGAASWPYSKQSSTAIAATQPQQEQLQGGEQVLQDAMIWTGQGWVRITQI